MTKPLRFWNRVFQNVAWTARFHYHILEWVLPSIPVTAFRGNLYCLIIGNLELGLSWATWGIADVTNPTWFLCLAHNSFGTSNKSEGGPHMRGKGVFCRVTCSGEERLSAEVLTKTTLSPKKWWHHSEGCGQIDRRFQMVAPSYHPTQLFSFTPAFNMRQHGEFVPNFLCQLNRQNTPFMTNYPFIFTGWIKLCVQGERRQIVVLSYAEVSTAQ